MNLFDTINQLKRIKRTGLVDTLKGRREPEAGTQAVPVDELRKRLLAVRSISIPLEVVDGEGGNEGDLVARWRIRDAQWWSAFHQAGTSSVTDLRMVLDDSTHEARVKDDLTSVRWNGNVPKVGGLSPKAATFEDAGTSVAACSGDDPLSPGRERSYTLETEELRELIGEIITRAGWTYRQVYRSKTLIGG